MKRRDQNYFVRLKKEFSTADEEERIAIIKKRNSWLLNHFRDVSYEIKKVAIDVYPASIEWVGDPEESLQMQAFQKNPFTMFLVKNACEKLQIETLKLNWYKSFYENEIKDLPNKTEWFYREFNRLKLIKGPLI